MKDVMNERYTIGELAKEAGISKKAIRIYEKKSLLKPAAYSENNYRLYDNEAKIVLQKIITLKFVGFSLDEIGELLEGDKDNDILKSLSYQRQLLELKRDQLDRIIYCVDKAAARCAEGEIHWNSFTDIMHAVIIDRKADEGHWTALKYGINKEDWYELIYKNLYIRPNEKVLDIGCGYGKLWRNNWNSIPGNVNVTLMDLHGTWADDFERFVEENRISLKEKTSFKFVWGNVENENSIIGKYDHIIANYLFRFIKEPEKLMYRIKDALSYKGVFYCIDRGNTTALQEIAALMNGFDSSLHCINEKIINNKDKNKAFEGKLNSIFESVERTALKSDTLGFGKVSEFYEYIMQKDFAAECNLVKQKEKFEEYFSELIKKKGKITIPSETYLYRCK